MSPPIPHAACFMPQPTRLFIHSIEVQKLPRQEEALDLGHWSTIKARLHCQGRKLG